MHTAGKWELGLKPKAHVLRVWYISSVLTKQGKIKKFSRDQHCPALTILQDLASVQFQPCLHLHPLKWTITIQAASSSVLLYQLSVSTCLYYLSSPVKTMSLCPGPTHMCPPLWSLQWLVSKIISSVLSVSRILLVTFWPIFSDFSIIICIHVTPQLLKYGLQKPSWATTLPLVSSDVQYPYTLSDFNLLTSFCCSKTGLLPLGPTSSCGS